MKTRLTLELVLVALLIAASVIVEQRAWTLPEPVNGEPVSCWHYRE